ncbi:hypothetical protein [Psychromicrobium lacuslunae]|uniref:Uncharacterized protein n=1 Tax=Psychromicrobium lacuslunae TaxID=1618207 RepID=A0A0D4C1S7_9MICC|nr:hypothetical protein [Psychromicrobium lacuslunae]AJT42627.1 hypothetical protein UM93_16185 [Psychromicrobium lacuslunae]
MSSAADTPTTATLAGFTRISRTALNRVLAAITAEAFSLKASQVKAEASDDAGKLAIAVSVPVKVPSLSDIARDEALLRQRGGALPEQARQARTALARRAEELTGSTIGQINIDLVDSILDGKVAPQ